MGRDKAFLRLGESLLIERAIANVGPLGGDIFIVGSRERFGVFGPTIEDIYPDCGPLGGIHAALSHSRTPLNLIIPVDMPFLGAAYLRQLVERSRDNDRWVTVTRTQHGLQPLCAVYRPQFKVLAEQALQAGEYRIDKLFREETAIVDVRDSEYDPAMFDNLNTADDIERASRLVDPSKQTGATNR